MSNPCTHGRQYHVRWAGGGSCSPCAVLSLGENGLDMDSRTFNTSGSPTMLFVMGFGNRLAGANERWAIDRLTDAGYRVHAVELPTDIVDFEQAYRRPVQAIHDEVEPAVVLSHSLGGLVTAHLETPAHAVYLSPWWGIYEGKVSGWERWLVPRLPIEARILPSKTRREEVGAQLPAEDWDQVPKRLSPVFMTEIYRAQQTRPPLGEDAVVFVSLEDTIISLQAVGAAVGADQIHLYEGGHQLFSTNDRQEAIEAVLGVLPV